jgi:hypothetical protein
MSQFQLGPFAFINLTVPVGLKERLARDVRSGVDGVTFWKTGKRGEPFSLLSVTDVANVAAAGVLLDGYHEAVGELLDLTWAGLPIQGVQFLVLDVLPLPQGMHATLLGIGGTGGTSEALLRCQWILEAIDITLTPATTTTPAP